jgi:protease-4
MKNFITSMLGALVTIGQQRKVPVITSGSYLVFDLSTNITDAPPPVDFGDLSGDRGDTAQLRTITRALRQASHDSKVKGLLLIGNLSPSGLGTGYAALREVRAAITDFRSSGKPVVSFITYATTRDYYLASAASEVVMDPYGEVIMPGLSSQPLFFGGAFEKYGIGVQVAKAGKYKSYAESYTRSDMSPEAREELQKLLDDVWGTIVSDVSKSRGIKPDAIQRTVDTEGLIKASVALRAGLVDKVAYRDEVIDQLKKDTGVTEATESFKQEPLMRYAKTSLRSPSSFGGGEVAVVYAEGDIVDGEGGQTDVGASRFARELRRLREDSSVKAIVLRVNSPGGSSSAAETIQREIRLARKSKPVVVSMGSYAASGGYWISIFSDRIYAEPDTITGSIGVFGIVPNVQKLFNDHGVTFDGVKTGKFADGLLTIARPRTDEEMAIFQKGVDWVYGQFLAKVSEGRRLPLPRVEEIAQGRVWSGTDAKRIGLVDEIGGLDAAVRYAAERANLGQHYHIEEYPKTRTLAEALAQALGKFSPTGLHLQTGGVLGEVAARVQSEFSMLNSLNDPRGIYARMPADLAIR